MAMSHLFCRDVEGGYVFNVSPIFVVLIFGLLVGCGGNGEPQVGECQGFVCDTGTADIDSDPNDETELVDTEPGDASDAVDSDCADGNGCETVECEGLACGQIQLVGGVVAGTPDPIVLVAEPGSDTAYELTGYVTSIVHKAEGGELSLEGGM